MTHAVAASSAEVSRRRFLQNSGAVIGTALAGTAATRASAADAPAPQPPARFRFCLNTATLMGQKLTLTDIVDLAAQAGYDAIEPWIRGIQAYVDQGGTLADLRQRIADAGLTVESAIGFAPWIVDNDAQRQQGLEQLKRDMDLVRQIGGQRIAAPPAGANGKDAPQLELLVIADRYRAALEVGAEMGVVPQVEIWGPSRNLSRLGEAVFAAVESGHPDACVLPDIYHIYRGGSSFTGLQLLSGSAIHVLHMNDYPAGPPRESLTDADRVYPGDGDAPLAAVLRSLRDAGFHGALSLELFNHEYWSQDAARVARTGLEKMKSAVAAL